MKKVIWLVSALALPASLAACEREERDFGEGIREVGESAERGVERGAERLREGGEDLREEGAELRERMGRETDEDREAIDREEMRGIEGSEAELEAERMRIERDLEEREAREHVQP